MAMQFISYFYYLLFYFGLPHLFDGKKTSNTNKYIKSMVLTSTDGEITERENNIKEVLKEKGKRLIRIQGRLFTDTLTIPGLILFLFMPYVSSILSLRVITDIKHTGT